MTMPLFAIAFPIHANKVDHWLAFVGELNGARRAEFTASRRNLKVHERTFRQETPQGDFIIVTLEGEDPVGAFARFGQGTDPFTQWFKAQVLEIHGMDLSRPPHPLPTLMVDSGG
jgi:hypothetical protein